MSINNRMFICGRVGADPEVKTLASGSTKATFSVCTEKKYTNKAGEKVSDKTWHKVVCWGKLAEIAQNWIKKGDEVSVQGEMGNREWDKTVKGQDGKDITVKMTISELTAEEFQFHSRAGQKDTTKEPQEKPETNVQNSEPENKRSAQTFELVPDKDDLPF